MKCFVNMIATPLIGGNGGERVKELKNDIIDLCLNERRDICNRMDQLTDIIKKINSEYEESSLSYGVNHSQQKTLSCQ